MTIDFDTHYDPPSSQGRRKMNTEVADALHTERGSYRSCRLSRSSSNGSYLPSTHLSDNLTRNGAANVESGFSGISKDISTPPSDDLGEENDASTRPSRRIKPVSRCELALLWPPLAKETTMLPLLRLQLPY